MKLGIVGHAQEKFHSPTEAAARAAIVHAIDIYQPELIISGHSPMGGVDFYAEEIAEEMGIPTRIFAPKVFKWDAPGGFRERNWKIANESDLVLCIVVKDFPPFFEGKRFEKCYHCLSAWRQGRHKNPVHLKSGGCWTAWRCKAREWRIIEEEKAKR